MNLKVNHLEGGETPGVEKESLEEIEGQCVEILYRRRVDMILYCLQDLGVDTSDRDLEQIAGDAVEDDRACDTQPLQFVVL